MRHLILGLAAVAVVAGAVAFSRQGKPPADLTLKREGRNPWSHERPNNDPAEFQFAIVSDRTGGHRARIFSRAVARLNLMQPEFVVSVGDLIEGGKKKPEAIEKEWKEFDSYVKQLQMPFFYVPGNHDTGNVDNDKIWQQRYGRRHYHFVYRDVLFLCLNTDDHEGEGAPCLGKTQIAYAQKVLADNKDVRWTLVFLHKPIWTAANPEKRGWLSVEKVLADRPYTVFCGHVHRYRKFVRQGRAYYQLATTGGGSKLRGLRYGEFDHIVWVTMKKGGPVLANVLLDSILPDDLRVPDSDEKGVVRNLPPLHPIRGTIHLNGSPVAGAMVVLTEIDPPKERSARRGDGMTESDGSFVISALREGDGLPTGKYAITVTLRQPRFTAAGRAGPNHLPAKYADAKTSGLTLEVKEGVNEVRLELTR